MSEPVPVDVSVQSFAQLFAESPFPLAVDTYQRGFVWNDDKIRQLSDDLTHYQAQPNPKPPYYMGTILVHQNAIKQKRFIIDGQQRLTALCVLHRQLTEALPAQCALSYTPKSGHRIGAAARIFREESELLTAAIFMQIAFTVIRVERVDLAFTFFDTQNNRGVPLHATDLLKAYHLRAVNGTGSERKEALQKLCAQRWEVVQQGASVMSHEQEFAPSLFTKFLWRARYWTGQQVVYGHHDALMEEFQKQTWEAEGQDTIPLYRSRHNRLGTALTLMPDGHGEIHGNRISLSPKPEDLPFAIRQPLHKGIGFFLYADKYAALLRRLVTDPTDSCELHKFRDVYTALLMANSVFLREIFLLASLMYSDQFDDEKLWEFSLWMDHALGAIRLEKQQVRYEAAQNFFKSNTQNLLDVIANSYRPEQIISHLKAHHSQVESYANENVQTGKGVQGAYKKAVLAYYGRPLSDSLSGKQSWITAKVSGGFA
ncbi:DUF262 domain-containing protein [Synechococcus sp. CS-1325]|uniref:DUF262 domain-containing protein n=1 Tax=Synechococcus sp. CS-1325 TaxID=2847979 RepID=UPI000DB1814F|nr:DUF262 domain-containing protein [Synechococcus sp. CS-1325]MCT0199076.1 DUF262 domain-containing protein [Synechococcus sp. CS-1325]PZU99505.1 MAG: DUF262 domain-containing protein [Cyanobium sp.]